MLISEPEAVATGQALISKTFTSNFSLDPLSVITSDKADKVCDLRCAASLRLAVSIGEILWSPTWADSGHRPERLVIPVFGKSQTYRAPDVKDQSPTASHRLTRAVAPKNIDRNHHPTLAARAGTPVRSRF
jgi:hypothetical protein